MLNSSMKGAVKRNISPPTGGTDGKPIVAASPVSVEPVSFPAGVAKLRLFITTWRSSRKLKSGTTAIIADHSSIGASRAIAFPGHARGDRVTTRTPGRSPGPSIQLILTLDPIRSEHTSDEL